MFPSFRGTFAVGLIGAALLAAAITPAHSTDSRTEDFMGSWITWTEAAEGERPVCRHLSVSGGDGEARLGRWNAPGWDGLVTGAVAQDDGGRAVWRGEWRDGRIAGAFTLALRERDAFSGTFAPPGGAPQPWHGRRDTGARLATLPCVMSR